MLWSVSCVVFARQRKLSYCICVKSFYFIVGGHAVASNKNKDVYCVFLPFVTMNVSQCYCHSELLREHVYR